jgi:tetratricopeptide (TPR) repeat protein
MKRGIIILIVTLIIVDTFANINFIDISKISSDRKFVTAFNYIKENQHYYDHWTNEWSYDKPKEILINKLEENYSIFSSLPAKKEELYLLLGDIAHYLYNLDDTAYYNIAVESYDSAIRTNPNDYRTYWFLGFHYALSNVPTQAIDNFLKAQELLPIEQPADFWNEYAWATAVTNMPSHCIFAMDKVKSISGKEGSFETQQGQGIYKKIVAVDKDKSYKKEDIWTASQGTKTTFISRSLGIKILVDSTWIVSVYDYTNHQSAFIINPPTIKNEKGKEIHYTVAILIKSGNDKDKLEDYISNFVAKYPDKRKISYSDKYDKMVAYEIKDKSMYKDIGGGHLYMLGIERNAPKYPGLLLENPSKLPNGNTGQVTYYTASDSKDRFKGKIFYAIMLDSCEDIHEKSFAIFKALFDNQIMIE